MEFVQTYAKEIVALMIPFITWMLNSSQRGEAKLVRGVRHAHTFLVSQPLLDAKGVQVASNQLAHTASVVVQNVGRKPATKIELVFNFKPMCINFWPLRNKTEMPQEDGRHVILFESLAPGEAVIFELLSVNSELPGLANVRCDQGVATEVKLANHPVVAPWKARLLRAFVLVGIGATAYGALVLMQFLVLKTPMVLGS